MCIRKITTTLQGEVQKHYWLKDARPNPDFHHFDEVLYALVRIDKSNFIAHFTRHRDG